MRTRTRCCEKLELSAPAGNWCALRSAVDAGADSVYFGVKPLNMRQGAENFDILEISGIMNFLHAHKRHGYLALNTIIFNNEIEKAKKILLSAKKQGVDAVILWDMSLIPICKECGLEIHISTQAGVSNIGSFRYYASIGAKRIVLARECSLDSIRDIAKDINEQGLDCQIEAFVHGAMCVSISGRCFLSHESFRKSANRGECLQPCRREFYIEDIDSQASYRLGPNYLLSPKDLCAMPFIDKMIDSGVCVFKIEGRNRSPEYVKEVTLCYRKALDAYKNKCLTRTLKNSLVKRLEKSYSRGLDSGFYLGKPGGLDNKLVKNYDKVYIGEIKKFFPKLAVADVLVRKGPLCVGDRILITGKKSPAEYLTVTEMQKNKTPVKSANKGERVGIKTGFKAHAKDKVFLIKFLDK